MVSKYTRCLQLGNIFGIHGAANKLVVSVKPESGRQVRSPRRQGLHQPLIDTGNLLLPAGRLTSAHGALRHHNLRLEITIHRKRSLAGSESSDEDMAAYIKAAHAIRDAFTCAIVIV
jgi:hypothetical protein